MSEDKQPEDLTRYQVYYRNNRAMVIAKVSKYYQENKEKVSAKDKARKLKNADKINIQRAKYREDNREELNRKAREYNTANRDKIRELAKVNYYLNRKEILSELRAKRAIDPSGFRKALKKHYDKNRHIILPALRKSRKLDRVRLRKTEARYYQKHRDKVLARQALREAKKKNLIHADINKTDAAGIYATSREITSRSGVEHEVDHIIPTAKNGWHHQDNLQVITQSMNASKNDDPFWISPRPSIKDWRDVPRHLWPLDLIPQYLALLEKHKGETIRWDTAA